MSPSGVVRIVDPAAFTGELVSRDLGDMRSLCISASTFHFARGRRTASRVPREHVYVNLLEAGRFRGSLAGKAIDVRAGDVLFSRATSMMDLAMEDATWLGLLIPRTVFDAAIPWKVRYDGLVFPAGTVQAALIGGLLRSLCALSGRPDETGRRRATAASLALIAPCLQEHVPIRRESATGRALTARKVRQFIVRNIADPALGIESICRRFAISRSALYRLLSDTGDIAAMIRRLRLHAVARDLRTPSGPPVPLASLAKRWGFADERSFRRAFVREFGLPPSAARESPVDTLLPGPVGDDFQRWLSGL